jgi:beta-hydroxyacyl-ACP dehydratase FabZ
MNLPLDVKAIEKILPHRYPFLLVDRIVELEPAKRAVGLKCVTVNEPFFPGHFPGHPIMPGVLIVEAMAQVAGVMMLSSVPDRESKLVFFMGIDEARFRRPVVPGDQLRLETEVLRLRARNCKLRGKAYVGEDLAAEAVILSAMVDREG